MIIYQGALQLRARMTWNMVLETCHGIRAALILWITMTTCPVTLRWLPITDLVALAGEDQHTRVVLKLMALYLAILVRRWTHGILQKRRMWPTPSAQQIGGGKSSNRPLIRPYRERSGGDYRLAVLPSLSPFKSRLLLGPTNQWRKCYSNVILRLRI